MYKLPNRSSNAVLGFTLIELMVALTIGMLMAFGLVRVFASSSDSYRALSQASQQIENGRYAIQVITDDLRHAGFYGEYAFAAVATGAPPDPCEKDDLTKLRNALPFHVQAYDGVFPHACVAAANIETDTDILVVRRASTALPVVLAGLPANQVNDVFMQAIADSNSAANPIIDFGTAPGNFTLLKKDAASLADIRKYHVHIYFVSPCSEPAGATCAPTDDGGRPIPTLKRLSLGVDAAGARTMRLETIAEGIERLQVDFGEDTDVTKDGVPDGAYKKATDVVQWGDVMAARVYVVARTPEPSLATEVTKTYELGTLGAKDFVGPFRRHLFSANVRMVNPAGRREVPE